MNDAHRYRYQQSTLAETFESGARFERAKVVAFLLDLELQGVGAQYPLTLASLIGAAAHLQPRGVK